MIYYKMFNECSYDGIGDTLARHFKYITESFRIRYTINETIENHLRFQIMTRSND